MHLALQANISTDCTAVDNDVQTDSHGLRTRLSPRFSEARGGGLGDRVSKTGNNTDRNHKVTDHPSTFVLELFTRPSHTNLCGRV